MPEPKRQKIVHEPLDVAPRPATILNIPNEVMHIILSGVDEDDIIRLGCLCRRLNEVAFGFYFSRLAPKAKEGVIHFILPQSISIGSTHDQRWSFRTFDALQLTLYARPQISSINTTFTRTAFPKEVAHASRYFRTRPELPYINFTLPHRFVRLMLPAYRKALHALLDSLTYARKYPLGGGLVDFRCPWTSVSTEMLAPSKLRPYDGPLLTMPTSILFYDTSFFFEPHFLDWTIKSLNACRLTTVQFQGVDVGPHFGLLQLDSLTSISLHSSSVTQVQFNAFLSRHPALRTVSVWDIAPVVDDDDAARAREAIASDSLPYLRHITMAGDYLSSWLSRPSTLPSPQYCHVQDVPSHATLQNVLRQLAKRGTVQSLGIPLYEFSRTSGWSDIPLAEREEPKLESVTGIIMMSSGIEQIDEATTERLVGALALFPCVEQV